MTFFERYHLEETWYGKVIIIQTYHLAMTHRFPNWTVTLTAEEFGLSISLVSENLKIAERIHQNPKILECKSRQEALRRIS